MSALPHRFRIASNVIARAMCFHFRSLLPAACVLAVTVSGRADDPSGQAIYQQRCASCHGENGEGTEDNYSEPLIGDRSVGELAKIITETMPEGEPELVTGEAAHKVAAYIHDAFYSELAQARNRPARIEFSRLTVRQYEQTLADLIGTFGGWQKPSDKQGLEAEYYDSRRFKGDQRKIERIDPVVDFDFGEQSPDPEKIDPEEFSIRWEGTLTAPYTGNYEFAVDTKNAARLYVNDTENALIDAWVKSGEQTEYAGTIRLLGGRTYPIKLEYFSYKEKEGSIHLLWKPPHQARQVVPARVLSPGRCSTTFVLTTPFPPDDRSTGFERGSSVSAEWFQSTAYAALEVARHVTSRLPSLAKFGKGDSPEKNAEQTRKFCETFAVRAFRRPLNSEETDFFVAKPLAEAERLEDGVRNMVVRVLTSPRFLYHDVSVDSQQGQPVDHYAVASRLSFALWDSLPDQPLLTAAQKQQLGNPDQVREHAARMVQDTRTKAKVREFLTQWLKLDHFHEIVKDEELYPGFDEQMVSDLRTSLELFLDDVVWSESSDFRRLLLEDAIYLNPRLGEYYDVQQSPESNFEKVGMADEPRAGVLTHPYLMAGFAYDETTSPIHRGVFIARSVLGRSLRPPPEAVSPLAPELHKDLTTRERVLLQTKSKVCQTCHGMINPLGFPLENFDAVGRFRVKEDDKPIDPTGSYITRDGQQVQFSGVKELAEFLASSAETQSAFVEQLFQYLAKQPIQAYGAETWPRLQQKFTEQNFNIQQLMIDIATTAALPPQDS